MTLEEKRDALIIKVNDVKTSRTDEIDNMRKHFDEFKEIASEYCKINNVDVKSEFTRAFRRIAISLNKGKLKDVQDVIVSQLGAMWNWNGR